MSYLWGKCCYLWGKFYGESVVGKMMGFDVDTVIPSVITVSTSKPISRLVSKLSLGKQ